MSHIKVMDEFLANKIAAGEVVEKTMNVVKELVENSIDAGSSVIKVSLVDSGVKEIKVEDNGCGMDRTDATLAFSRHATSKLKDLDDLFNIASLGFRGEALPSIASVSQMELKTSDGEVGTFVFIDGGKNMQVEAADLQEGTTITVKNLFYNTPVRLKYLKNLYIELANIVEYLNKMALAYPNIKFSLTNNGKTLLDTAGDSSLLKVIYNIYGIDVAKKMVEISGENDDYYVSGYISYPEVTKSNRNSITTLVNGRVIKNNNLNKMIVDSYHTYIPKDKFPIVVLNIDVDPILIDINIHPTKMDIKFSKFDCLEELVTKLVREQLEKLTLIPTISVRNEISREEIEKTYIKENNDDDEYLTFQKEEVKKQYKEETLDFDICEKNDSNSLKEYSDNKMEIEEKARIKKMIPKGIVYSTYIIAENEDGMYIIDQHAAAERINYEKVLKEITKDTKISIDLLVPIKIELPSNEYLILKKNIDILKDLGFNIEEFGLNTIIVRTHPIWIKEGYEEEDVRKVIDIIVSTQKFDLEKFVYRISATQACRMSIKANDYINRQDQEYLLDTLRKCENPFTCPHGRPTIITYTKYDLEKLFKRALD